MKIHNILILIILITNLSMSFAQVFGNLQENSINPEQGIATINGTQVNMERNFYEGVKGSAMLLPNWVKGGVSVKNAKKSVDSTATFNFDAFKGELHIRFANGKVLIPFGNEILGFDLQNENSVMNFTKKTMPGENSSNFYQAIYETPQYQILKLHRRKFIKAEIIDRGVSQSGQRYDEFVVADRYYVKGIKTKGYVELKKLTSSTLCDALPEKANAIKAAIKTLKFSKKLKDEEAILVLKAIEQN